MQKGIIEEGKKFNTSLKRHLMSTSTCASWAANLIQCSLEIKAKNEIKLKKNHDIHKN